MSDALYLRYLTYRGVKDRYGIDIEEVSIGASIVDADTETLANRIEHELATLEKAGFPGYMLIVSDILRFCREAGIPTGPGRGSICGCAVAYAIGITDVDPLRFNIPFERFLHLERIAQPDIDLDICQVRRPEVIDYLRQTYGGDSVSQIITFTPLNAKGVVRDVCRVLHVDEILRGVRNNETGDRLALMIPEGSGADLVMLTEHMESKEGAAFAEKINALKIPFEGDIISVVDTCLTLEGLRRHGSVHAAGVVITNKPLIELTPLYKKNKDAEIQTQFDMRDCEVVGLLKMDILGLRTVTVMGDAEKLIRKTDPTFKLKNVPLDDQKTFDIISHGDTGSIFQLEGDGITNACKGMIPDRFEDIIALIALYRPGPMEQLGSYFDRKHGKERVEYAHPALHNILERSYGLIVYQEQVMGIVRELGGYSAGEADMFRKAIGKKLVPLIRENIDAFIERAVGLGHDREVIKAIGDQIFYFGRYGFNLGHATGYAFITYWTAYLKANYPCEFFAANLDSVIGDTARIGSILRDAEKHGIHVRNPSINSSAIGFSVNRDASNDHEILFGIGAIKGLGDASVLDIIEERDSTEKNGYSSVRIDKVKPDGTPYKANIKVVTRVANKPRPFSGFWDFCKRLPSINITIKRNLVYAGAFGSDDEIRQYLLAHAEDINLQAKAGKPEAKFSMAEVQVASSSEILRSEKEVLGFYITNHPLAFYKQDLFRYDAIVDGVFDDLPGKCIIGGMVIDIRLHQAKNGEMAWVSLETGITDMPEVTVFASIWGDVKHLVKRDEVLVIHGTRSHDPRFGSSFKADRIIQINRARPDADLVHVSIPDTDITDLSTLVSMDDSSGTACVQIAIEDRGRVVLLTTEVLIKPTGANIAKLEALGWLVSIDPTPDSHMPWRDGSTSLRVERTLNAFGGSAGDRIGAWQLPMVKRAISILSGRVINELKRIT